MRRRQTPFSAIAASMLASPAYAQATTTPVAGVGQMLLGLAAVIALVFGMAWLARRLGVPMQDNSPLLKRVASLTVGPRERVLIIEAGDQWLVIGVTAQQIQTLHHMPKGELPQMPAHALGGFAALLQKARGQHVPR